MDPGTSSIYIALTIIVLLAIGVPVAFTLAITAIGSLVLAKGLLAISSLAENFFAGLAEFTLLSIPMFIVMGAAVAASPAGRDLYEALDRWLNRVPGGLIISNISACSIFSALSGSSPATCAAIGKMGIPEMRKRGYSDELATGAIAAGGTLGILIPPSITMIVYGIATETSIGRLFLAGLLPGLMLTGLFMAWSFYTAWRSGYQFSDVREVSWGQRFSILPRVLPFLLIIVGVLWTLYGGVATPSEAAGVGAAMCILMAIVIYRIWKPKELWKILSTSMKESVMILMIIGCAALFSHMLSSYYITQAGAEAIAAAGLNKWVLMLV